MNKLKKDIENMIIKVTGIPVLIGGIYSIFVDFPNPLMKLFFVVVFILGGLWMLLEKR